MLPLTQALTAVSGRPATQLVPAIKLPLRFITTTLRAKPQKTFAFDLRRKIPHRPPLIRLRPGFGLITPLRFKETLKFFFRRARVLILFPALWSGVLTRRPPD